MYTPTAFKMEEEMAINIMKEYSFATLFSQRDGMPVATQLPLLLNHENTYLYGHFARANPHWKEITGQTVLVVFHGPHCYISPSWYETNQTVPTWNYITVQVYGQIELLEDEQEITESLRNMVIKYEASDSTYDLQDVSDEYLAGLNKGIQAFKLKIDRIEGKAKLSQNHSVERQNLVIRRLEQIPKTNEQEIALYMKKSQKR